MTKPLRSPFAQGRSTLLRAGRAPEKRPRAWLLRYTWVGISLAVVTFLGWGVHTEWFAKMGPARPLYMLHDHVWLPLHGSLWNALFPDAAIWITVVFTLTLLVLAEYLGLAGLIRRSQSAVLRRLVFRAAPILILWNDMLGIANMKAGLAQTVVRDLRTERLLALTRDQDPDPKGKCYAALCHLTSLQLRLAPDQPHDLIAVVDALALAKLDPLHRLDAAVRLEKQARRLDPTDLAGWSRFAALEPELPNLSETLVWANELASPARPNPATMACRAVLVARAIQQSGAPEHMAFFDTWARQRSGQDDAAKLVLAQAEDLCAFEFWAALAEGAASGPLPALLLSEAFPEMHLVRDRGERFAAQGANMRPTR